MCSGQNDDTIMKKSNFILLNSCFLVIFITFQTPAAGDD